MARQIVGEIYLNTRAIDGGVSQDVQGIINRANNQAASVPVDADTAEAEANVARLAGSIETSVGGAWAAATAQAVGFTAAVVGIRASIEGVVNQLAGLFDNLRQAQAGFTAILGSESAGTRLLDEIREFARVSPFVTEELVTYSQQLLGVGQAADSIVPLLRNTGDLIASVGGDTQNISRVLFTLTQIRSIGRLVGQDAIQLQSALVPITKLLADFLGKTTAEIKKMQEQGAISADTVFAAINAAGEKVEGAMAQATRNISGARSVLSDTVKGMAQESVFLNRANDDIVKGILRFTDALSGNERFADAVASIDRSLVALYESLQPVLEGLGSAGISAALSSLEIFASTLEILSSILNEFPTAALDLIGKALAVFLALKAPLVLLTYTRSLSQMATVLSPDFISKIRGSTTAIEEQGKAAAKTAEEQARLAESTDQTDQAVGRLTTRQSRLLTVASTVALGVGMLTSSLAKENEQVENLGNALSGAAVGAQLGSAAGPWGAAIGAAAGAGVGYVTSFVTNARQEAEKRSEELKSIGQEAAADFLEGFTLANPEGISSDAGLDSFMRQIGTIQDAIRVTQDETFQLLEQRERLADQLLTANLARQEGGSFYGGDEEITAIEEALAAVETKLKDVDATAVTTKETLKALFSEGEVAAQVTEISTLLGELQKASPDYVEAVQALFGDTRFSVGAWGPGRAIREDLLLGQTAIDETNFDAFVNAIDAVGLDVSDFEKSLDQLVLMFDTSLPGALKVAQANANEFKTKLEEAKKATDEFFGGFGVQASQLKAAADQTKQLADAQKGLAENGVTATTATQYATALLTNVEALAAVNQAITGDAAGAIDDGLSFALASLEELRTELSLTTNEFEDFLQSAGLFDLYQAAQDTASGFVGTLQQLSEETGVAVEDLRVLLNVAESINSTDTEFVYTADTLEAIENIERLERTTGSPALREYARQQREELLRIIEVGGAYRVAADEVETATSQMVSALQRYMSEIDAFQTRFSQGNALADAFEQVQFAGEGTTQFAEALLNNFRTITSAASAAGRSEAEAVQEGLSVVSVTLQRLQDELGLADDAFLDLLDTMGLTQIYNDALDADSGFFGSIDELVSTTGLANDELREMLGLADSLSGDYQIVVTADITDALAKLRALQGMTDPLAGAARRYLEGQIETTVNAGGGVRGQESNVLAELRKQAAEEAQRERERAAEEARRLAEQAAREAERLAEEQRREQERIQKAYEDSNKALQSAMESAAEQIESAAQAWTQSIRTRAQDEEAATITRLLRNAGSQASSLDEIGRGLVELQSRGLSEDAIRAIGIDNVTDVRQVRRLLQASPDQLAQLSQLVATRDANAEAIARRERQAETQATIVAAILQAASILGVPITQERAQALSLQLNVDAGGDQLPANFIDQLLNGQLIVRS